MNALETPSQAAQAQREFCSGRDENGQVLVTGGRIVLTVLTPDTIGQRVVGELPITPMAPQSSEKNV